MIFHDLGYGKKDHTMLHVSEWTYATGLTCGGSTRCYLGMASEPGSIKLSHVPGAINPADAETKALSGVLHH